MKPRIALSVLLLLVLISSLIVPAAGAQAPTKDPEAAPAKGLALDTSITGVGVDYAWSQATGTYTEITGGTQLTTSCDDTSYNANPIPFTFTFNGTAYTQFSLNCNGFIAMGATVSSSYTPISSGTSNNVIAALGGDQQTNTTNSEIRYETLGAAPNQVLVIQWKNLRHYGATGDLYNYQIRLYETSNLVEVVYGPFTQNATARTSQIGLRGASSADFNNRSGTGDWLASAAGTVNTATMALTTAYVPPSGLTWTWTPLLPHPVFDTSYKVAPSLALLGGPIAYTVHIKNTGTGPANSASLVDPIPAGTTYNGDVTCSSGACGFDGSSVTWAGTVAVGGEETVSFSVGTEGLPCGSVVPNDATLSDPGLLNGPVTKSAFTMLIYAPAFVTEGFETSVPPSGWTETIVYDPGTDPDWSQVSAGTYPTINPHSGAYMAKFNSFNAPLDASARLATYALDFSTAADPRVSFYMSHDAGYSTNNDRIQMQVSTDGGATWADVGSAVARYDATYTAPGWGLHTVDLSAYAGQPSVMVGLLGISAYGNNFYLDDVSVFAMCELVPEPDIEVTPQALSAEQCPDTQTTQTLTICNVGEADLTWSLSEQPAPKQEALVPDGKPVTPAGSTSGRPVQPLKARIEANDILLISTTDLTNSVVQALNELGYGYDYYYDSTGDWTGLSFAPYQVVIVGMDGGTITAASIQKVRTDVIDAGKRLIFLGGTCWSEFAFGVNNYLVQNDTNNYCWQVTNPPQWTVVDPGHPLAAGLPGSYNYNYYYNGYYATRATDPALETVAINGEAWPALFRKVSFTETAGDLVWYIDSVYSSYWTDPSDFALLRQIIANSLDYSAAPDIPWLSEDPTSGTVAPATCQDVTVTFDSAELAPADYFGDLLVDSNDPDEPQVDVPAQLTVEQCAVYPDIEVTPEALSAEQCPDTQTQQTLNVCNVGDGELTWTLAEGFFAGSMPFVPVKVTGGATQASLTPSAPAGRLAKPEASAHPEDVLWDQPLSSGNQNAYVNQDFSDLPTYSSFLADDFVNPEAWDLSSIFVPGNGWNGFASLFNATALTWQIYADNGGVPDGNPSGAGNPPLWTLTLAPTDGQVTITNGTGGMPSNTLLSLATPVSVPAGHWWLVFYPSLPFNGGGQYGRQPADTLNGYWTQFVNPGGSFGYGTAWQSWAVIGADRQDMAFRLEGTGAPGDVVPWLSEDPVAGTLLPGECAEVTVTFDSTGLAQGDYYAGLSIDSNDPDEPQVVVPVQLTVLDCELYPEITVSPAFLSATLCEDSTEEQTLTICNEGEGDLIWGLTEAGATFLGGTTLTIPAGPAGAPSGSAVAGGYQARPAGRYTARGRAGIDAPPNVLLLAADDDNTYGSPIQGLLQAYGDLGAVDLYDPRAQTPTLADLQAYDVVVVWSNYPFADATAIGNVLADYVDAGGRVIDMMYALDAGWGYQGRFRTEAYTAMTTAGYTWDVDCLGAYDPGHPVMAGVTAACDSNRGVGTALTAGSAGVAWWSGGELFVAAKYDQTVVTINGYVGYYYVWTGQMPDVLHNAILWLAVPAFDAPWLSEEPASGIVAPGTCQDVTVTFDSTGLVAGDYFANLLIDSNDPDEPQVVVPVQLTVEQCAQTMHIGNLTGNLAMDPYGRVVARWYVLTHDDEHAALPYVLVEASIWDPIGGPFVRTRITKISGWTRFHWGRAVPGSFQLCVDNLTLAGYTYVPGDNDVPNCLSLP